MNQKNDLGYATVIKDLGGMDYRTISENMSRMGFKMNHNTARNDFLRAMSKLAKEICEMYEIPLHKDDIYTVSKDHRFQDSVGSLIQMLEALNVE